MKTIIHGSKVTDIQVQCKRSQSTPGLETYFFGNLQTFASGCNLNSQIAVSSLHLVFTFISEIDWINHVFLLICCLQDSPHSSFFRFKEMKDFELLRHRQHIWHARQWIRVRSFDSFNETSLRTRSGFGISWNIELTTFFKCLYFQLAKLNLNLHFASLTA